MYATFGVAAATLVVVGAILAGPAVLDCSKSPDGLGACLRSKVGDGRLVPPVPDTPDIAQPSAPAPQLGWMEANANEYEPPLSAPVELAGTPMELTAAEVAPPLVPAVGVEMVPAPKLKAAAPPPIAPLATVAVEAPTPGLIAEGTVATEAPAVDVALAGPEGQVVATSPVTAVLPEGAAALLRPTELAGGALTGTTPADTAPAPVELRADVVAEPATAPVPVVIEFNPEYPNVLVLPPPSGGDNSSFRSLQLN